ncbi:MAG TPA: hypothetical protein PLK55_03915 [archaeon]|jgi:hypothetical protein|nr:hypothetical protein [archaeon]
MITKKKKDYLIPIVIFIGIATLFFFPSPADHLLQYFAVMLFFVILIIFLIKRNKR